MQTAPTIIVADDNEDLRRTLVRALVRVGYWVLEARNGGEALALLDHVGKVDLIVTDMNLPDMNGLALALEFQARLPGVQVVLTSGGGAGPKAAFLAKPFKVEDLLDQAKMLVGPGLQGVAKWTSTSENESEGSYKEPADLPTSK